MRNRRKLCSKRLRSAVGVSLTELLVGSLLLGSSLAVVAELMSLCVVSNTKLFRQFDAQAAANFTLDRLKRDIRMATEIRVVSDEFSSRKQLSSTQLILRQPVHYLAKSNDPTNPAFDPVAQQSPLNGYELRGYYTVVYEVVPDAERPGEYMLTTSTFRNLVDGASIDCSYREPKVDQVLIKGIVGPISKGGTPGAQPKVFSYVARNPFHNNRLDLVQESALYVQSIADRLAGVSIDLELKRGELSSANSSSLSPADKVVAVHAEAFPRLSSEAKIGLWEPGFYE